MHNLPREDNLLDKTYIVIAEYSDISVLHQIRSKKLSAVTFDWCQKLSDMELKHWGVTRRAIIDEESTYEEPTPLDGLQGVWDNGILIENKLISINIFILPDIQILDINSTNNKKLYSYCSIVNGGIFTSQFIASKPLIADQEWLASDLPWYQANEIPLEKPILLSDNFFQKLVKYPMAACGKLINKNCNGTIYRIITESSKCLN